MNGAHLHLMTNHVSLFCMIFGAVMLAISMKRKSVDLRVFAVVVFVIGGLFGWIAFQTGEQAEDIVKALGTGYETFIEQHEQAADWALRSSILVAVLALVMEWTARKKQKWFKAMQWVLLVSAIHGTTVFAATAYLGGQIRHSEVRSETPPQEAR